MGFPWDFMGFPWDFKDSCAPCRLVYIRVCTQVCTLQTHFRPKSGKINFSASWWNSFLSRKSGSLTFFSSHGMFQAWKILWNVPNLKHSMECCRPGTFHGVFQAWNILWNLPVLEHPIECSRPGKFCGIFQTWNIPWSLPGLEHSVELSRPRTFHGMFQAWDIPHLFAEQHILKSHLIGHSDIAGPCAARGWGSSQSGADSNFKCQNFHLVTHLIVS